MTSLAKIAASYKNKKVEATKNRRKSESRLHSALAMKRRSSSGLSSLERRKDTAHEKKEQVSQLLTQYLAQKDSVQRLKIAAEGRLKQEEEAKEKAQQETDFAESPEDKARVAERVKLIDEKITELHSEIKQRNAAEDRLAKLIADVTKSKSKLDSQIRQQFQSKPLLLEQLKSSTKAEETLRSQVKSKLRQEQQASRNLIKINQRLAILKAKKRKSKRKAKKKIKRRSKTKRRAKPRKMKKAKTRTMKRSKTKAKRSKTRTRKAPKRKVRRKSKSRKAKRSKSRRR